MYALYSAEGKAVGVICTIHNSLFTDEYMVKSTLKIFASRAAAEIERKKVEKEFNRIQQQLAQSYKMEAMGQLVGGIAHDFNNVLHSIAGYCQILQKKLGSESPLYSYPGKAISISQRASAFTNQFLSFTRREEFKKVPVYIHELIDDTVGMLERMIEKTVVIRTDFQPQARPVINGDDSLLQNMLINLVVNARDAMPDGGEVTIKTKTVKIDKQFIKECPRQKTASPECIYFLPYQIRGMVWMKKHWRGFSNRFLRQRERAKGPVWALPQFLIAFKILTGLLLLRAW
jgi:signal transduction histidine kinase